MRAALLCLLTVAGLLISAPARADRQVARELFLEGNRLRAGGDHAAALAKYRAAYRQVRSYKIDLNMGLTLMDLGRKAEAAVTLERFLRRGASRSPGYIVRLAHKRLAHLKRSLASVRIQCTVAGAAVLVNGRLRGRTPLYEPLYFSVGGVPMTLDIRIHRRGYLSRTFRRVLRPGRHVELEVRMRPGRLPGARDQLDLTPDLGRDVPDAREQLELDDDLGPWPAREQMEVDLDAGDPIAVTERRRKTIWGFALLGTGLALAVTAGVLYGVGVSDGDEAHALYSQATAQTDQSVIDGHRNDVLAARSKVAAGSALLGVGVVAAGVAVYLLVTRPEAPGRYASRPALGITPLAGGAAISLGGRF